MAITAILTLALGIGAATAIVSVINGSRVGSRCTIDVGVTPSCSGQSQVQALLLW